MEEEVERAFHPWESCHAGTKTTNIKGAVMEVLFNNFSILSHIFRRKSEVNGGFASKHPPCGNASKSKLKKLPNEPKEQSVSGKAEQNRSVKENVS